MPFDFSNVKSLTIPVNGVQKEVKQITDSNSNVLWKANTSWTYTINIGNYVFKIKYKIDNGSWIETTSSSTTLEIDNSSTLYVEAVTYNTDNSYYTYTQYNFNISKTSIDDGGSITIYQTRADKIYSLTVAAGDYINTLKVKVGYSGTWSNASSSITVQTKYNEVVLWELVSYNKSDNYYYYSGDTSSQFNNTNPTGTTVTINRTRTTHYYNLYVYNASNSDHEIVCNGVTVPINSTRVVKTDCTYNQQVSMTFSSNGVTSSSRTFTMEGDQTAYALAYDRTRSVWTDSGSIYAKSSYGASGARIWNDPYGRRGDLNDGRAIWCRDSSYNKVRINWRDTIYEGDVPSEIPYNWNDGSWKYNSNFKYYTSANNGKYIAFWMYVVDDEDYSEQNTYIGVANNNSGDIYEEPHWLDENTWGTFYLSVTYGKYVSETYTTCSWYN